ncbi:HutD family protein [Neorhizobium sp. T786]|uniref:HutD/Ves family protein n=1 Tax=Pseudorhizobium xiangyangii TaxID=2883104 RepID=UPI001CFFFB8D|nr:HutD family protein [Neorhizobium xiangyangii]MCB5203199.1 HutD family protein [Neorhizobium xiangyangii]
MRVMRAADYKRMPWKNGGGETVEIAVFPPQASLDDFGWRISMATVATDGPFSAFSGIDRTLSILDGAGMVLSIAERSPVVLDAVSAPHAFPADVETSARLIDGPITDLNVMTRRGMFRHTVERRTGPGSITGDGTVRLILCGAGELTAESGSRAVKLEPLDVLLLDEGENVEIPKAGIFYLVAISAVAPHFV